MRREMHGARARGASVVVFHICSVGQVQFMAPIYREFKSRQVNAVCYLACDYDLGRVPLDMDIPASNIITSAVVEQMLGIDIFLQAEIYGRGPKGATRVFVGHGQPNKITNWSHENLKSFDYYFLYGQLTREMFEVIMADRPESTKHIKLANVGYPKLDDQVNGRYHREETLRQVGLDPSRRTVLYAPAWDPGGSLQTHGTRVVQEILEAADVNVMAKLHPCSLEPPGSPHYQWYTGGVNWLAEFRKLETNPRFRFVDAWLVNPILAATDVMVTDFSGVALEFMLLDRPVIYIDCPEFYEKTLPSWNCDPETAKNDDRFNAGRNAGRVIGNLSELGGAIRHGLEHPEELSDKRKALMKRFLYNPGQGAKTTVDVVLKLLKVRRAHPGENKAEETPESLVNSRAAAEKAMATLAEARVKIEAGDWMGGLAGLDGVAGKLSGAKGLALIRALCLERLGRKEDAVHAAAEELQIDPEEPRAIALLSRYPELTRNISESLPPTTIALIKTLSTTAIQTKKNS